MSPERLTHLSSRHPWRALAAWAVTLVAAIACIGAFLGSALTTEGDVTTDTESKRAYALLREHFPPPPMPPAGTATEEGELRGAGPEQLVIVSSDTLSARDARFRAHVMEFKSRAEALGPMVVSDVTTPYDDPGATHLVSRDGRAALVLVAFPNSDNVDQLRALVDELDAGELTANLYGGAIIDADFNELSQRDLEEGELRFGVPSALIVLLIVFGAVVAAAIPMLLALIAITIALGMTAIVGQFTDLSVFVINMISGVGLALGIDYTLFVLSRYREERRRGLDKLAAIDAAGGTATRAVVFSGVAVVLALFGMVIVPDTIMRSLGIGAILVGIVSVATATTLTPALLSLLGDKIDRLRLPYVGRSAGAEGRFWAGVARAVQRRPVLALVTSTALLLAMAAPVLAMERQSAGVSTLPPETESRQGYEALKRHFAAGALDPVRVVIEGRVQPAAVDEFLRAVDADPAFTSIGSERRVSDDGELVDLTFPVVLDPATPAAMDAVQRLREEIVPQHFGDDTTVLVAGDTAERLDYVELTSWYMPVVFTFVLGLSFVLLTIAFRSIVVAAKAIALNLLSVGAAYGLMVLVFQKGYGNELLGFDRVDAIEAWVPLFLFSLLFGLSMDYHVFLLSRIRERFAQTRDNAESVTFGVGTTARLITGAALIIVAVFSGFAAGDLVMFQQMGFGVAVSLLIDATLIRSVLLPAAMYLLGERNWYLPPWLRWLPDVRVEGHATRA